MHHTVNGIKFNVTGIKLIFGHESGSPTIKKRFVVTTAYVLFFDR